MWPQRLVHTGRTCPILTYISDYRAADKNTLAALHSEASGMNEQGLQVVGLPLECGVRMRRH
jgi:hypothetical protein